MSAVDVLASAALGPAETITAIGVLAVCLTTLGIYHAKSAKTWAKERAALLAAAEAERTKRETAAAEERQRLTAAAAADRQRYEDALASERDKLATVYERRVDEQKEAADRLYTQNAGWMDLVGEVNKVLSVLNERVGPRGGR